MNSIENICYTLKIHIQHLGERPAKPIRKEHIIVTILTAASLTFGFYATGRHMELESLQGTTFWKPSLHWDSSISLNPNWIWVYLSYFLVNFLPLTFKILWTDIGYFRRIAFGFIVQFAAALLVFWIFPSQMVRPIIQPQGISEHALAWVYKIDGGFNVFPSLHVANIAYVACLAWAIGKRALSITVWVLCFMIAVSTLFVKQHYLLDLPAGVLLGVLGYYAAFSKRTAFLNSADLWNFLIRKPKPAASSLEPVQSN